MNLFSKVFKKKLEFKNYSHTFLGYYSSNKKKWFIRRVELPKENINEICSSFNEKLELPLKSIDFEQHSTDNVYEFEGENLIQHSEIKTTLLGDSKDTESLLKEERNFTIETAEEIPVTKKIEFLVHSFNINNQETLLFTKHQGSSLFKKTIYSYANNEFVEIDKKHLYIFNNDVTCALINDGYYIFNVDKFAGLFKYWSKLEEIRDNVVQDISKLKIVENFDEYSEIYGKFYNMKSIIKIKEANMDLKKYIKENKDTFEEICTQNNLSLVFDKNKESFNITDNNGVTVLNRIFSGRSGYHLSGQFITFPSFEGYEKNKTKKKRRKKSG